MRSSNESEKSNESKIRMFNAMSVCVYIADSFVVVYVGDDDDVG